MPQQGRADQKLWKTMQTTRTTLCSSPPESGCLAALQTLTKMSRKRNTRRAIRETPNETMAKDMLSALEVKGFALQNFLSMCRNATAGIDGLVRHGGAAAVSCMSGNRRPNRSLVVPQTWMQAKMRPSWRTGIWKAWTTTASTPKGVLKSI
eukprot:4528821-Amphidinium_carterae.1